MKTTPWFKAGKENPVRDGAYEIHDAIFKYWDGRRWGYYAESPERAREKAGGKLADQNGFQWRGLLKESK
jgi:hypothetical protein